ncbi:MAG TPA: CHAT domain-containing protein, partial [Candidatus Polarisedimenticolia bacterium]|nr:CHAT domain-containing protein [Candidatus Polarisedimenticolia bacterium]
PGGAARAFDALAHSRALVLDEMAERHHALLERGSKSLAPLIESLARAREGLGAALQGVPDPARPEEFPAALERARAAVDDADRALAERSAPFRAARQEKNAGLDEILHSLPPEAALVAYARYRDPGAGVRPGETSYLAFVLASSRRDPIPVALGQARTIDRLVADWRRTIERAPDDAAAADAYNEAGLGLRQAIWDPVAAHLGRAKIVFIVPDADLNLVNYATFPAPGGRYLLETGPTLHYLSAERDLVAEAAGGREARGLLALGGPDFDAAGPAGDSPATAYRSALPACARAASLRFDALPGAREEAREVASQVRRAAGRSGKEPILVLTGQEAGEEAVKRLSHGRRILHLATHHFWFGDACDAAAPRADDAPAPPSAQRPLRASPLLLTGLALAGVNRRDDPKRSADQEDGLLTADEISSLDLRGTEWVVLSACQSGVGPVLPGEGVLGLRRAFRIAGARTLVMSLWAVGDQDAREWVRELYAARLGGRSTAESLRLASRRILDSRREAGATTHPHTWGAFVSAGDWR